jgi:hypothetical protein
MGFWGELGKTLVKTAALVTAGEAAKKLLDKVIKNQIRNNAIKLAVFFIAILISYISVFGENISLLISSVLMLGILLHSMVMLLFKIPPFLRYIVPFLFEIISRREKKRSIAEIITQYVANCYPWIFKAKDWLYNIFGGRFNGILPTVNDLVDYIWGYIGKQTLVFVITLVLYIVSFNFIVRPRLQSSVLGVSGLKMYLVPFAMAADFIFKTRLMQWVVL